MPDRRMKQGSWSDSWSCHSARMRIEAGVLCVVALMWSQHSHPCIVMGVCRVLYVLGWLRARMRALRTPRRTPDGVPPSCASLALSVAHSIDSSFLGATCETPTRPKHAQPGHTHVEASTYNTILGTLNAFSAQGMNTMASILASETGQPDGLQPSSTTPAQQRPPLRSDGTHSIRLRLHMRADDPADTASHRMVPLADLGQSSACVGQRSPA